VDKKMGAFDSVDFQFKLSLFLWILLRASQLKADFVLAMTAYGIVIASLRSNPEESKYQSMRQFEMHTKKIKKTL
jgi:hypothetical protein